ncbi:unnamed protein product [Lymnaea stagnalis]|uniref:Uncharacterized protein n=1 Tax=Lymnaea stagnalis TaxID=6523 RepID=A0AAV2I8J9_LYMST
MDTEKIERLRERMLQCAVCMDEYKDPRILPCHHTLCFECISNVLQSSSTTGRLFKCPQCRSDVFVPQGGITNLPINFYITSLQDELGTKGYTSLCEICERDWLTSQFRCIDCDIDICHFCIHAHRLEFHADPPKVLRIETANININQVSNSACSDHAEEILQMYCCTCNKAICISCSFTSHKKHSIIPLSKKMRESKSFLQSEVDSLTSEKRNALKAAEVLEKMKSEVITASKHSMLALDVVARKSYDLVMQKKFEIARELKCSEEKQLEKFETALQNLKMYIQRLERGLAFLLDLQDNDVCLEVLDTYKEFSYKLDATRKIFTSNHIRVDHSRFTGGQFSHIFDVSLGICRKICHFGNLGNVSKERFCLSVIPKTLGIQKRYRGVEHVVKSSSFKCFLRFLFCFAVCQFVFFLGDVSGLFGFFASGLFVIYTQLMDLLMKF